MPQKITHGKGSPTAVQIVGRKTANAITAMREGDFVAELCLECFLAIWRPNAYDRHHLVMSKDRDFCECCMDFAPYVDHVDHSARRATPLAKEFAEAVTQEMNLGHTVACTECGANFERDDLAFTHETGECPYCHKPVEYIWMKG